MIKKILFLVAVLGVFVVENANAQQNQQIQEQVNYEGQIPVDTDLDGLTDQSELQLYKTDSKNPDTDGDGYYDGVEVMAETDPLDGNSIPGLPPTRQNLDELSQNETPWPWYVSRMSGLVAFVLLYLSILLGLTIRIPFLGKFFAPLYAMQAHCWIALQATIFAFLHGISLVFDKFLDFRLVDVFVPFVSSFEKGLIAVGVIGFYLMIILVATSYGKKYMSHKLWRAVHFLSIILYAFVVAHAYYLGTDMNNVIIKNVFVYSNLVLVLLMSVNMFLRIKEKIAKKKNNSFDNNQNLN